MMIIVTMFVLGVVLGFIGAGGSGFIIAVLVTFFDIPIYHALGTAAAVMFLSVLTGSWSHFREGNLILKQGLFIGLFGSVGSYVGTRMTKIIDPEILMYFTVTALVLSGLMIWLKTRLILEHSAAEEVQLYPLRSSIIGLGNGMISGTFGIGAAPFIQLSLLKWLGYPMFAAAGTTMLVLIPISLAASLGFMQNGFFDSSLFLKVALGTIVGSYIGAKLTKRLPRIILRYGMVVTPVVSAMLLLIHQLD
ncbi:sulfite exporter TauE/SafE family protein [Paenibacillus naphthalenovorans]|uniref:Probable membrane transporter protein n=1 Tax=Paenibacillus naphthalenovorans TaxID=162209 RepID=A0A0U2UBM8_9BACL|nr:membrane protein [Paenibacillus naphthalenovorans]